MHLTNRYLALSFLFGSICLAGSLFGQGPKVIKGKLNDPRLKPLKDLNGYFPFSPPKSKPDWEARRARLRQQTRIALGLFPEPTRTPLNARIHGKREMDGYSIEKVIFESMPGFYVTGSLYRPVNANGKVPAVLCPHGHWANGRFYDAGEANAKKLVEQGGEEDVQAARNHMQARSSHLARMGCVVLLYDMIGYADNVQISERLAHGFSRQRPEYNRESDWGLFSPQAESHLQSVMGLQTWNSIRALDFLESLPEVDGTRLAVTGASGGGTQSFLLAALDDRISVSFPAVMVSTAMQGGCTCENSCLLRVTTGNVELAGLFAPKPLGVTAANDWTKEMSSNGFPELQQLYQLLGAKENLTLVDRTEFGHNFNLISRTAMYLWLKKHFRLSGSVDEKPLDRLDAKQLTVWTGKHKRPKPDPNFERRLLSWWTKDTAKQIEAIGTDRQKLSNFFRSAYSGIFQRQVSSPDRISFEAIVKEDREKYWLIGGPVSNSDTSEQVPTIFLHPKNWNGKVVLVTSERGKDALFDPSGKPTEMVSDLLEAKTSVVGVDLLFQGEFLTGKALEQTRRVENPREAAAYTFGYNHTLFSHRTHDLVNLLVLLANHEREPKQIEIVALDRTGAICAAALTQTKSKVKLLKLPREAYSATQVNDIRSPWFLPGSARYRGVKGMLIASGVPTEDLEGE